MLWETAMVATAALETAELQRGDGAWENIQDVLRSAFLALQQDAARHAERLALCEQRVMDLGDNCAGKVELQRFSQQTQHVEALARAVGALSDELRDLVQREDARNEQHATWAKTFAVQLSDAETRMVQRIAAVEDALRSSLAKLERRLALVDEELGHLAVAVDSKADVESVQSSLQTHRKTTDDALKQRCRKAAFDREVLRVHQLLRSHQTALVEQHEALQRQLSDELVGVRAQLSTLEASTASRLQAEPSALRAELAARVDDAARQQQAATDDVRVLLQLETAQTRGACRDALAQALEDARQSSAKERGEASQALALLQQRLAALQSDVEVASRDWRDALETQLRAQTTQAKTELEAAIEDWTRARERRLRQQLHAVAARLSEMDQVLKLAGQQLVQNTSQLQLLWAEWQRAPPPSPGAESTGPTEQDEEPEDDDRPDESSHSLRREVEAKLRDYRQVLEPPPHA
ncbi:hypothetical protein P43SY_005825 [Pythium insidiosum]|uniref:Uncharacterized protein n=1 Tax=Pythium insidiosum TaxID=114742 RepID=A0AAD5QFE5_PYTIN|nr:hypothetical protein P43SY_005825 [Pythium insidiosum]